MLVLKMQWVRLVGRIVNISPLVYKAVLRRTLFTSEGSRKESKGPCSTAGNSEQDEKILQPLTHMLQVPGKQMQPKLIHGFSYWLKVPTDKVTDVKDIVQEFRNSSLLGIPIAHTIYGLPSTVSAGIYVFLRGLKRAHSLNHPDATALCAEQLLEFCWGQGMEIYWHDNYKCPSVQEYQEIAKKNKDKFRAMSGI